jgi:hypothetical protein
VKIKGHPAWILFRMLADKAQGGAGGLVVCGDEPIAKAAKPRILF